MLRFRRQKAEKQNRAFPYNYETASASRPFLIFNKYSFAIGNTMRKQ